MEVLNFIWVVYLYIVIAVATFCIAFISIDFLKRRLKLKNENLEQRILIGTLQRKIASLTGEINILTSHNNRLEHIIAVASKQSGQFTPAEIKTLIQLCHPDKHGGKQSAVHITSKLLKMR